MPVFVIEGHTYQSNGAHTDEHNPDITTEDFDKFYSGDGWLTGYALACGYVESITVDAGNTLTLLRIPGTSQYDVRGQIAGREHLWESYATLRGARKAYRQHVSELVPLPPVMPTTASAETYSRMRAATRPTFV